jgi:hypothetical protein
MNLINISSTLKIEGLTMKIIAKGDLSIITSDHLDSIHKGKSTDWERTILLRNLEKKEEYAIVSLNIFGRIADVLVRFNIFSNDKGILSSVFDTEKFSVVSPCAWNSQNETIEKIRGVFIIAIFTLSLAQLVIFGFNSPLALLLAGIFMGTLTGVSYLLFNHFSPKSSPKIENESLSKIINPSLEPVT